MVEECIFCKIINGEIPADKLYEDEHTFAFLDISPVNKGHTLVIPKAHHKNIFDMPSEVLAETMKTVQKMAKAIKEGVGADGINIGMNNLPAAGQVVFHAHFHIIPRFEGDGFKHWPHTTYEEGESKEVAGQIQAKLL